MFNITSSVQLPFTNSYYQSGSDYRNDPDYRNGPDYRNQSGSAYRNGPDYRNQSGSAYRNGPDYRNGHDYQTRRLHQDEARKQREIDANNPTHPSHWNKEVSPMDSKDAWVNMKWQAWRNAQIESSGSYIGDGYFEV